MDDLGQPRDVAAGGLGTLQLPKDTEMQLVLQTPLPDKQGPLVLLQHVRKLPNRSSLVTPAVGS